MLDTTGIRIPFNRPTLIGTEVGYVQDAARAGHLSGNGPFTQRVQTLLEALIGAPRVLLATSCTHALEMSALLLRIEPGDEIVVPSFTFPTTANAFVLRGARPVFADIRPDTLNLDESKLEGLLGPKTKAIVPVHYAGVGCEMDEILSVADGIPVVEDNAHGLLGGYRGRPLGSLGCLATQSFHETKNFSCGEGGALVVNDVAYAERAEVIRDKGTDRSRFYRGQVDAYTWVDLGSSYLPSEIQAAFLYAQLEARADILAKRARIWNTYAAELADWAAAQDVTLPMVPAHCTPSYHMFHLVLPSLAARQALIAHLRRLGILSVFHYRPLHLSRMGRATAARQAECPVTESIADRLVRIPFFTDLTHADQAAVLDGVTSFVV